MKANRFIAFLKYIIAGLLLLFLFHFESLSLGPLKISHLWKGVLLCIMILYLIKVKQVYFYQPLILLSLFQILNLEIVNNLGNAILLFSTTLILPLLGAYFLRYPSKELKKILLFFSVFFILVFVPYEMGLLVSIQDGYDLTKWGGDQDLNGLLGPFQTVHSASSALAGSFLVILYFWFTNAYNKILMIVLLIMAFYFLINTYARTGLLMVALGSLPMVVYLIKKNALTRLRLMVFGGIFAALTISWVFSNKVLVDRISGERIRSSESESVESLGSGRGKIYLKSIEIYLEANFFEQLIGMGQTTQRERMKLKVGHSFIPHNGFLLILLNNGFIGLSFFVFFLVRIIRYQRFVHMQLKPLIKSLLIAYVIMTFFQNFEMIYMYLLFVIGLAYAYKKSTEILETSKYRFKP